MQPRARRFGEEPHAAFVLRVDGDDLQVDPGVAFATFFCAVASFDAVVRALRLGVRCLVSLADDARSFLESRRSARFMPGRVVTR